jgi:flagellin
MATINTNIGATRAANALANTERDMNVAMERLSTGKRINTAQDDAAGLAIASKMTSQINSLNQAVRNAGDAISMVQSADGAMIEITNMVQRMRELAIQSISDTNTVSDRSALNLEFQALAAEVSRIGGNTQWNGGNILDGLNGVNGTSTFHIGANADQVITATFPAIGSTEGDFNTNVAHPNSRVASTTGSAAVAGVFNRALTDTQVAALTGSFSASDGTNTVTLSKTITEGLTTVDQLAAAINSAGTFGMTASVTVTSGSNSHLVLTFDDPGVISTAPTMKTTAANGTDTALALTQVTAGATAANSQVTTLSLSDTFYTLRDGDTLTYTIDGKAASATIQSTQSPDGTWSMTGVTPATARGVLGEASGAVELAFVDAKTLTLTGTNGNAFTVDNIQVTRGIAADIGKTDISSFATATAALSVLDGSVATVNMKRAELGAVANRLEYASDNMANISMNAAQSRSRVEDADYASETTELARTQIIQQAGTAMLAQANQSAQSVLKLLQ